MSETAVEELIEKGYREDPSIVGDWEKKFRIVTAPGALLFFGGLAGAVFLSQKTALTLMAVGFVLLAGSTLWASVISSGPKSPATGMAMDRIKYSVKNRRTRYYTVFVCHRSKLFSRRLTGQSRGLNMWW